MSSSFIIVKDRTITLPLRRGYITGRSTQHFGLDGMYTPHGFIANYWRPSMLAADYIAGRPIARDEVVSGNIAVIVTHEGHVYSLVKFPKSEENAKLSPYLLLQLPIGDGYQMVDAHPFSFSDTVCVALDMNNGNIANAIDDLNSLWGIYGESYVTLNVDDIAEELRRRDFTKAICRANPYRTTARLTQ